MMEKETSEGEHQKESDQDRKELEKKLQDVGIDPHIWLPRLRGHLNITRAQALQYVGFKDYQKLQHYCEHEWEKEALQKLLNIQEKESQSNKRRDDQSKQSKKLQDEWSEAFKKRQQEARSALNELQHMQEKGRNRNDGIVKEKEEQLQLALQVPKEYWVHSGVPLQDLIENMHKQLHLADCSVLKRDHLSDEEVLKCASGGLALEGIYKSNRLEDAMVKRERLLDVPESFSFSGPEQMPLLNQQDVSSREAESTFRKAMEKIGLSITCSAKAGFWGFGLEINTNVKSSSQSEQTCQSDSAHSYACTTKYNYIPLASCFFGKDQLHLSNSALRELKSIDEAYLKNNEEFSKQRCLEFFQRFGTHANQGPLHFGGIFWWKASSEGFSAHEMNEVKTLTSEALSTYVGASYSGPVLSCSAGVDVTRSKSAGFASHDRREALWRNIELSVSKTGGPAEADSLLQWKAGLIASNKTWCVIDRGLQIVPVWDIIICNHKEDFRDAVKLANSLSAAYDMLTKHDKKAAVLCGGELNTLEDEAQAVLHGIRMWNVSTAEQHLMKLIEFKKKLTDEKKNVSVWTSIFLSDAVFQDFLTKLVATHTNSPCDDTVKIRFLMRHLLEDNIYDVGKENFPNRSSIVKWIHQSNNDQPNEVLVSEFSQLAKLLHQAKNDTQEVSYICGSSEDSIRSAKVQSTRLITDALYTLRKSLIDTQKTEEELLLLTISAVKGYSDKDNTFDHLLGWPEIEFLLSKLESAHAKYSSLRNESVAKAQAFLISTGLTVAADCTEVSSYEKKLRLAFMKAHLKETVSEEIAMLIDFSAEPVCGWDRLEEDLNSISKGTYQSMVKNVQNQEACLTKDLEDISKMKTQPQSTAKEISVALSNKEWGVIERLGLQKYYPKKMTMSDILVIDKSALEDCQPSTEPELLFFFLQKLLMLDYKARDVFCNLKNTAKKTTSSTPTVSMSLDDFFCDGNTKINKNTEDEPKHIHPMDVQMAIYHCADSFLWQYIATKLSFCQYALPCLVPNPFTSNIEFPSWSFVQLKKSWKCSERADQQSKTAKCKSQSLYEAELPTVSFIRFGPSASSKSQILNNLLNSQKHNTFFHRHCKGSSAPRLLMEGVVERSWYFPGGKDDDVFDDCVAFTNLHGDAREHEKQFEFLLKTATINVVLLTGSDRNERGNAILQKLFNSPKPLICLCSDMKVTPKEQQGTKIRIAAESRNEADLVEDLVTTIKCLLGSLKHTSSIKTCTGIARNLDFLIEEDHEHCKQGKSLAEALLAPLKSEKLSVIKDKYLPLQGELWHTWCKKNKELLRLQIKGNISVEQHKSHIEQAKNDIRKKQFSKASPMNNVIRTFLTNLQCNSEATKVFFLKWMEIFLYDLTSEQHSGLDETQHEKWSKMQALKKRGKNVDHIQKELDKLSNERIASTFSLEHFLRELGQIYEALESQSRNEEVRFSLPEIAADMMISGYSIELMDGDASHVPLKWISSVLDKVIEKLGDQRVFVLSVLGIQSTGKSTLLNAMFGLQFAVSAGRCTRGAFMQLVRVKEDLRREKQLDYVLVVDTEGLRTLEVGKSTLNHDNELATFVIGLGNMTLINIFGENPSDMQDVIQIAVQAFLRMKQIHLTPSCMFVHQNVGEVTAGDKNMEGKRRMLAKLDDMSRTAAKQELCDVSCFNDVIRFDVNTHIHYFAHLWEGNPPMAPPNPSYSENVQKLKRMLLCSVTHQNTLKISGFKTRVQDLWSALLAENFVFSFKNTLEIAAYRKLEEMYADWTWRLRSRMLDIENKLKIKIEHDRGEVVEKKDLESDMQTEYNAVTKEMECYFSEDNDREILIQWKRKIEQQLADVKDQIIGETKRKFDKLVQQKKSCWDLEEKKSKYEDQLLQRSKELALRLKAKDLDEEKLKSEFRKLWSTWVYDVSSDMPPAKKTDVKIEMEQILIERLAGESLSTRMESGSYKNLQSFLNFSNYISINKHFRYFNNMITSEEANQLSIRLTQDIIHSVTESIKVKERANVDYSPTFIHEIVNKIGKDIQDFQSKEKRFVLKNNYKTDLCLMLCYQAAQRFQGMHNAFQTANDPLTYLKNKKEGYFGIFATFCKGATSTTGLADFVGSQLKEAIRQEVYNKTNADLAGEIRSNTPAFKGNRSNLESHILKTLAEDENFDKFMEYIHHPKQYFEEFINQSIDNYCWDGKDPRILKVFRKSLEHFKIRVLTAISKSTEVVQDKNGDVPMWLDEFCGELKEDLEFTRRDLKSVEYQEINDIRFLEEAMTTVLEHVVEDLEKDFRLESSTNTKSSRTEIQEKLFDHLCGCWEQCPFCSAICTNTISDHDGDHSVDFHRPTGIRGVEWYETDNLIIDICSSLVGSDCQMELSEDKFIPFRNYREAGPSYAKWSITPDSSLQPYWKWFVCQFQSDLEKYYSKKCHGKGEIPAQWKTITKSAAIESLKLST